MGPVLDQTDLKSQAIQELCRQIADGCPPTHICPHCARELQIRHSVEAMEVSCSSGCFRFSYHRDPLTGTFVSGLLDLAGPNPTPDAGVLRTTPVESPRLTV